MELIRTNVFQVEIELDSDGWRAIFPALEDVGASTWEETREDAITNIQEVLSMMVEEFDEAGQPLPATERMSIAEGASIAITT